VAKSKTLTLEIGSNKSALSVNTATSKQAGITLIELVVVMAILAIIASMIVPRINIGGNKQLLRDETLRLAELVRRASDESIFKRTEIGVLFSESDYQFLKLDGDNRTGKWVPFESDVFRMREWPESVEVEVQVAGVAIELESSADAIEFDEKTRPHVMILSNGEIMPDFKVIVDKGVLDDRWQVATGVEELLVTGVIDPENL